MAGQEIIRDFESWWNEAGCALADQALPKFPHHLLLIAYTQGRMDEAARVTRQMERRLEQAHA